ncbi:MAG: S1C family serine protease [Oscillospiraceae bacterium]|jgi:serine protease Do|nr:S1C family serine protease [Oscillospiraceae bacterium]
MNYTYDHGSPRDGDDETGVNNPVESNANNDIAGGGNLNAETVAPAPQDTAGPVTDWRASVADLIRPSETTLPVTNPSETVIPPEVQASPETQAASETVIPPARQQTIRPEWCDPSYSEVPPQENAYTPSYSVRRSPETARRQAEPRRLTEIEFVESEFDLPPRSTHRNSGFARAVCLALVCAIISAVSAWSVVEWRLADTNTYRPTVILGAQGGSPSDGNAPGAPVAAPSGDHMAAEDIYDHALTQVVSVLTTIPGGFGQIGGTESGTGFIISEDGYILTNYHVVESAAKNGYDVRVILRDGTSYTADIVGYEPDNDIAVIKIDAVGLSPAKIGSSGNLRVGETIYAVGNPRQLDYTMTNGIVSALDRKITVDTNKYVTITMFQISAAVNTGNSGGPVYDSRGAVVGIVSAKYNGANYSGSAFTEGLGFAIPIDDAMTIASELIQNGYVTGKAKLGVTVETVTPTVAQYYDMVEGTFVKSVEPGSCAETAGIKSGDIITKLGDTDVTSTETLKTAKRAFKAGDETTVTVNRHGEVLKLTIVFDEDSASVD